MRLSDVREIYVRHSTKASDITRQAGFAGIALVWLFRVNTAHPRIENALILPLLLIAMGLAFDFFQYAIASLFWGVFGRIKELKKGQSEDFLAPRWINWPGIGCFWGKLLTMTVAYFFLLRFLYTSLLSSG